ncbi:hypothetical protein TEQG_06213 [Trichophyton equinum CBS 127.97]|uniref:Uncharacterized protein n=1 Tax=Trichophyton equinum (strain ATCC MYA-4606 / CBS 127.97) TaxID=559882 RepID=F2PZI6_TRIEC|nr:hypothetical protein TEQG_06213 [Trichophyton equinum CBS 127.97]
MGHSRHPSPCDCNYSVTTGQQEERQVVTAVVTIVVRPKHCGSRPTDNKYITQLWPPAERGGVRERKRRMKQQTNERTSGGSGGYGARKMQVPPSHYYLCLPPSFEAQLGFS